jgi:predicted MFS family arabinose efflux permease
VAAADRSRSAVRAVFASADVRRLELAWLGSVAADFAYSVTISVYAHDVGGARAVGVVWLLRMIPSAVGAPFVASLAERYPGDRVIVAANVLLAALSGATAVAIAADAPSAAVYVLAIVAAMVTTVFWPAQAAVLPSLARTPAELTAANTASITLEGVGSFIGPALCGLLLAATSVELAMAATAGVFLLAALPAARVGAASARTVAEGRGARASLTPDFFRPFIAIVRHPRLRVLVAYYGAWALAQGALNVLVVVLALDALEIGDGGVGLLTAAVGVGGVAGAVATLALAGRGRLAPYLAAGSFAFGVPLCLLAVRPGVAATVLLLAVVGAGNLVIDVASLTLVQRTAPDELLMRVLGVVEGLWVALFGVGAVAVPALIDVLGLRGALAFAGAILPVSALLAWHRLRTVDEAAPSAETIELVLGVPFLASLPAPALERLVGRLVPVRVPAGDDVFRQDERGDRFYIVGEGRATLVVDGRPVSTLEPGDFFGEIAILRDTPRTGTVSAVTEVELLALDRVAFLSAIGGSSERETADAVVEERLARAGPGRPRGLVWSGPR